MAGSLIRCSKERLRFWKIAFIIVNSIINVTKGQLLFNAITGFGDWYGSETFMPPIRTIPSGCIQIPCIPWLGWRPEMLSSGFDSNEFTGNMGKYITLRTTKKPKEKKRKTCKSSKKTEESNKDYSSDAIRVRDTVRGGRDKASLWQTFSPVSVPSVSFLQTGPERSTTELYDDGVNSSTVPVQNQNASQQHQNEKLFTLNITEVTRLPSHQGPHEQTISSNITGITTLHASHQHPYEQTLRSNIAEITKLNSPFQDQVIGQRTAIEPHVAGIKLNKTFNMESPRIQVYVIASGSGGAHTSIGEGGYHDTLNGQSNFGTFHFKENPKNLEIQKANVHIKVGITRPLQESRKRNSLVSELQERNSNSGTVVDSNTKKIMEIPLEVISNNDSDVQLNSEDGELKEVSEKLAEASDHEIKQEILGSILKHGFQNHWLMRK